MEAACRTPALGTYMRPVGLIRYAYCGRLERIAGPQRGEWDADDWTQWQMRRFGLDERGEPLEDGHQNMIYVSNLHPVARGVWREDGDCSEYGPVYWREMGQRGQLSLFDDMQEAA